MNPAQEDVREYIKKFESGLKRIADTKDNAGALAERRLVSPERIILDAIRKAIEDLGETTLGKVIFDEYAIKQLCVKLEDRLAFLRREMGKDKTIDRPHSESPPYAADERRFHFYGEFGQIVHQYRDIREFLTISELDALRKRIKEEGSAVADAIDELLGHVVTKLFVRPATRKSLQNAADNLKMLKTISLPLPPDLRELLSKDNLIIRKQYAALVCDLCLKLFGHIDRHSLDAFLEIKSVNANEHDLLPWRTAVSLAYRRRRPPVDNVDTTEETVTKWLNRNITSAFNRTLNSAMTQECPNLEVIKFAKAHRRLLYKSIPSEPTSPSPKSQP